MLPAGFAPLASAGAHTHGAATWTAAPRASPSLWSGAEASDACYPIGAGRPGGDPRMPKREKRTEQEVPAMFLADAKIRLGCKDFEPDFTFTRTDVDPTRYPSANWDVESPRNVHDTRSTGRGRFSGVPRSDPAKRPSGWTRCAPPRNRAIHVHYSNSPGAKFRITKSGVLCQLRRSFDSGLFSMRRPPRPYLIHMPQS